MAVSPGPKQRQAEVAETFLRAQAGDQLPLRIEPHAMLAEILGGHLAAEAEDARRLAIAVVLRVSGGLGQLFDHQVLRRIGRIAHAQVDHVVARTAFFVLQPVELGEQIGGQAADALGHFDRKRPALRNRFDGLFDFGTHRSDPEERCGYVFNISRNGDLGKVEWRGCRA